MFSFAPCLSHAISLWTSCKGAWKQTACLRDLANLGLCLKLLLWKDQGTDWFDIKSAAESGALSQTHTLVHMHMHTQTKTHTRTLQNNYIHAESITMKISEGTWVWRKSWNIKFSCSSIFFPIIYFFTFNLDLRLFPLQGSTPAFLSKANHLRHSSFFKNILFDIDPGTWK